ncbi:MAG: hypothetical protein HZA54_17145 [Planctomycetes bacterium]|nr:hypothetical protein [Planctomycetota bacterium]
MSVQDAIAFLRSRLAALRRRRALLEVIDAFWSAFFYAFFAVACLALLDRIRLEVLPGGTPYSSLGGLLFAGGAVMLGCLLYGVGRGLAAVPTDPELARDYDRALGLADRFASALDLALHGRHPGATPREVALGEALIRDAERATRDFRPGSVYLLRPLGYRWTALVALLIAAWIPFVPIPRLPPAPRPGSTEADEPTERAPRPPRSPRPPHPPGEAGDDGDPAAEPDGASGGGGAPADPLAAPDPAAAAPPPAGGGGGGKSEAGKGSPEELLGDPERLDVNRKRKEVDPLFGDGKAARKEMEVYEGDNAATTGAAGDAPLLRSLLQKYSRVAEDTLAQEAIPGEERDYVRRYFEEIRPK